MSKIVTTRTQLQSQVNENEMVLEELNRLDDDASVLKMIGPTLIKQDLVEAKSNVNKRIEYIKGEIDRLDKQLKGLESKSKDKENEVSLILTLPCIHCHLDASILQQGL
jgi:prefoldin beta subunit